MTANPVLELDGPRISRLLCAGIQRLLAGQEHLNKINVYPVPDGDTGTNMALTLRAVLASLARTPDAHAGNTLTRAADAALDGARGNSGAILAQFLLGVGDSTAPYPAISTEQFAAAASHGATYARDSLTEPREGTVLTVISAFASEAIHLVRTQGVRDFLLLFTDAVIAVRRSLLGTATQLDEMRKAGVVDAGAQGFVYLLEGMTEHLERGVDLEPPQIEPTTGDVHEAAAGEARDLTHRFCTECTVVGTDIDRRKLREDLSVLGSSLVLAGTPRKAKIHIHVNEPAEVFRVAGQYGEVTSQKADDMQRQQHAAHAANRRVAVVTDSVADIPEDVQEQLDIHVVPLRVHFGEHSYLDKVGMSPEAFLEELVRNPLHPKTSQPPAGDFRRQFEFLASHSDGVISINVTSKASGTANAATTAAARVQTHGRVEVIDSLNASVGQGLLVMYAAEAAARGAELDEIVARTRAMIPRTHTYALVGSLAYAVRGGRVKPLVKSLAGLLRLTPVLFADPEGNVRPCGMLFGRRNIHDKFVRFIARRMLADRSYRIGVGHANVEAEGRALLERMQRIHPRIESSFLMPVGSALSVHGGPGTLVVGIQEIDRND
ncbi:MAG TPA: DegV family protein [Povalibacter sp.]|nr:DegV family protein [Povalibacter sp.]